MTRAWLLALLIAAPALADTLPDEQPVVCERCAEWNRPRAPFHVLGDTSYVGVAGLTSVVVRTSKGLVLLDGGLPQSASPIITSLTTLGLSIEDVKLILTSHAHFDHVGGVAALARRSGARVLGSAPTVAALALGHPTADDPQVKLGSPSSVRFPIVKAEVVRDGESITLGDVTFTAHLTPGHTPGSTTWTWLTCEGTRCANMVYADSLNAISDDGFRFSAEPRRVAAFRHSIDVVEGLPCDVLLSAHPEASGLDGDRRDFVDKNACRAYAQTARKKLEARLAAESR